MSPLGTDFQTLSTNSRKVFSQPNNLFAPVPLTSVKEQGDPRPDPASLWGKSPVMDVPSLHHTDGFKRLSHSVCKQS